MAYQALYVPLAYIVPVSAGVILAVTKVTASKIAEKHEYLTIG